MIKKLILRTLLFLGLLLILLQISKLRLSYYWAKPMMKSKIKYLTEKEFPYDTYFLGSSHVHHQIIPSRFDSINQNQTNSFNLGAPAMRTLESLYYLKHLLKDEKFKKNTRKVFIELGQINNLNTTFMNSNSYWYCFNFKYLINMVKQEKSGPIKYAFVKSFFRNSLLMNNNLFVRGKFQTCDNLLFEEINERYYGFGEYGYEINFRSENCPNSSRYKGLNKKKAQFKKTPVKKFRNSKLLLSARAHERRSQDQLLIEQINKLSTKHAKDSIEFVILIPFYNKNFETNCNTNVKIVGLDKEIGQNLIAKKYFFDWGHFNLKGSKIYTEELGLVYQNCQN